MMGWRAIAGLLALGLAVPVAFAQAPAPAAVKTAPARPAGALPTDLLGVADIVAAGDNTPAISFDVVSIKASTSATARPVLEDPPEGDGIRIGDRTLFDIMRWDFNARAIREEQLMGVPEWFKTERFDIQAKVAAEDVDAWHKLSEGYRRLVFRKVLVEQFKLAAHWAEVEEPDYNLVIAKGGLKIKPVQAGDADPNAPKGPDGTPVKEGIFLVDKTPAGLKFACEQVHMSSFAKQFLVGYAGKQVYDQTGIPPETVFKFTLEFVPDRGTVAMPGAGEAAAPVADSGPSLFTALQEQLGLKLEPGKGPVGRLVIDHVERPGEN